MPRVKVMLSVEVDVPDDILDIESICVVSPDYAYALGDPQDRDLYVLEVEQLKVVRMDN